MPSLGDVGRHVGQHRFERAVEPAHEEAVLVRRPDAAAVGARSPYDGRPRLRAIRAWRARGRFVGFRPRGRIGHGISSRVVNSSSTPERAGPAAVASRRRSRIPIGYAPNLLAADLLANDPCLQHRTVQFEHRLGVDAPEEVEQRRDEAGPPGLVAGAEPGAVVAVEVLVEQDQVAPVRIVLELRRAAVHRPPPVVVAQERRRQPPRDLLRDLEQRHVLPEPVGHSTLNSSP